MGNCPFVTTLSTLKILGDVTLSIWGTNMERWGPERQYGDSCLDDRLGGSTLERGNHGK